MDIYIESDEEGTKAVPCGENSAELMTQEAKIGEGGPNQWEVSSSSGNSVEVTSEEEKLPDVRKYDNDEEVDEDDADVELVKEISLQDRLKVVDSIGEVFCFHQRKEFDYLYIWASCKSCVHKFQG